MLSNILTLIACAIVYAMLRGIYMSIKNAPYVDDEQNSIDEEAARDAE